MKERPILMSIDMVRAIIAGNKTQTRRILKVKGCKPFRPDPSWPKEDILRWSGESPYGKEGDILWVREAFAFEQYFNGLGEGCFIKFSADYQGPVDWNWRPSIHLPKLWARIWLQIESLQVEHVQDISESDAKAEGSKHLVDYRDGFFRIWIDINGIESWEENPWVWVIKFKVLSTVGKPEFLESEVAYG